MAVLGSFNYFVQLVIGVKKIIVMRGKVLKKAFGGFYFFVGRRFFGF